MEHKAGDKMFVDYTGDKLWIYPPGELPHRVEVFIAILGCSLLTYVEAVAGQIKEDFISACENAFYFYGGVPQAIVPDNLKAAVTKASRVESTFNEEIARDVLSPLTPIRYQIKKHVMATVGKDGYVRLGEDIHCCSVPHSYIGKKLKLSYTCDDVQIFGGYTPVARHTRSRLQFKHTTDPEHLHPKHKAILAWTPEAFIKEAADIHEDVEPIYVR